MTELESTRGVVSDAASVNVAPTGGVTVPVLPVLPVTPEPGVTIGAVGDDSPLQPAMATTSISASNATIHLRVL